MRVEELHEGDEVDVVARWPVKVLRVDREHGTVTVRSEMLGDGATTAVYGAQFLEPRRKENN